MSVLVGCTPALIAPGGKSLESAYRSGADFIHLKPGNYSSQNLPQVNGHKFTLVNCAPGAKINGLTVYGDKAWFRGCDFDGQVYVQGAQGVSFTKSDFGPTHNRMPLMVNGSEKSTNLSFTGNRFHDATASGDAHTECAWIAWTDGLTMTEQPLRAVHVLQHLPDPVPGGGASEREDHGQHALQVRRRSRGARLLHRDGRAAHRRRGELPDLGQPARPAGGEPGSVLVQRGHGAKQHHRLLIPGPQELPSRFWREGVYAATAL